MYPLAFLAMGICFWGFWQRLPVYRQGKPLSRLDHLPERIVLMVKSMLAQSKVLRVLDPGALHALFFWGSACSSSAPC